MSHSKPFTIKVPPNLAQAAQLQAERLGYQSFSSYVRALMRRDLMDELSHADVLAIARMRWEKKDAIDAVLLKRVLGRAGKDEEPRGRPR